MFSQDSAAFRLPQLRRHEIKAGELHEHVVHEAGIRGKSFCRVAIKQLPYVHLGDKAEPNAEQRHEDESAATAGQGVRQAGTPKQKERGQHYGQQDPATQERQSRNGADGYESQDRR